MDKRTEYVEQLSAQMVEWDVQIEQLKDKVEGEPPEAKFDYAQLIAALQLKRDQAAIELQGIAMASDDEWEDLKSGAEQIWNEVQDFFSEAVKKMK
jgi:hypothetical protein